MKAALLICFFAALSCTFADERQCPHPDEARHLLVEQHVNLEQPREGRAETEIDISPEILGDREVSCVTAMTTDPDAAPAIVSIGRNRQGVLQVKVVSGERKGVDTILSVYSP